MEVKKANELTKKQIKKIDKFILHSHKILKMLGMEVDIIDTDILEGIGIDPYLADEISEKTIKQIYEKKGA